MRSGHPGMHRGTYQNGLALGMTRDLENTLEQVPLAVATGGGSEGLLLAEETAEAEEAEEILLAHGTTADRAGSLLENAPSLNPGFGEDPVPYGGFSMVDMDALDYAGEYANLKSLANPEQGGPAMLFVYVPKEIANLAYRGDPLEWLFQPGYGFDELVNAWPGLTKWRSPW